MNEATPTPHPRSNSGVFTPSGGSVLVLWEKLGAHRRWMIGAGLLLVALACYFAWHGWQAHEAAARQAQKPPAAIPVRVVTVRTADFPVYLKGLGTVEPFDTVTVKSRVDGQVIKVAFKQGEMVKEGDILIQIDPKPYQATLDQALAKKTQDEANLKNAETIERYGDLAKRDFASRQQVDTQQASVDQLTAQLKGDEAMIDSAQTHSTTRPSARRSRAAPASAWSTRATSSMPTTRPAW